MSSLELISAELVLLEINRLKLFSELQNLGPHSFLGNTFKDLDRLFASVKSSIQTCLDELSSKSNEIEKRSRELESRERELKSQKGSKFNVGENGEKLLSFVIDQTKKEHDKVANSVHNALILTSDPAKLVLEAVRVFWSRRLSFRDESEKKSSVILLKQLMKLGTTVNRSVRRGAVKLAREWKLKLEEGGQRSDMEVLGFLMFLAAYKIGSKFDSDQVSVLYYSVDRHQSDSDLHHALGLVDRISESSAIDSRTTCQQLEFEKLWLNSALSSSVLGVPQDYISSSTNHWPEMKAYCKYMDGTLLISFLCDHMKEHDSMRSQLSDALRLAPDPAKLVMDVLPYFHRSSQHMHLPLSDVRKGCIFLLEQLVSICPHVEPYLNESALTFALDWKQKIAAQKSSSPIFVYGFLQLVVTYRLVSAFNATELLGFMVRASDHRPSPNLCVSLGLVDKAPTISYPNVLVLIKSLLKEAKMLKAIDYICAFKLHAEFNPGKILRGYLKFMKKRISKGKSSEWLQTQGVASEITTARTVIKCILDHRLESYFPTKELQNYIVNLEKKEAGENNGKLVKETTQAKESAGSVLGSYATCLGSVLDSSTSLHHLHFEKLSLDNSPISQARFDQDKISSSVSCWPQLTSFCSNMDGSGLISFLCDHVGKHDSMRRAISDAFQLALDPAKLVLDVLPVLHQLDDDPKHLRKVRKSCFLLLEQLVEVSPCIEPSVSEAALKFALDWKQKMVEQKFSSLVTVYGFLQFIITYSLMNSFDASELLDLLVPACKYDYKLSPNFCHSLGLAHQVPVLIERLLKESLMLEAVEHVCAFNLYAVFPPELILKSYLEIRRKAIYRHGSNIQEGQKLTSEIASVRAVINCIAHHGLESRYPPKELEDYIVKLEKQKTGQAAKRGKRKAEKKQNSANTILRSDAKLQQFQLGNMHK